MMTDTVAELAGMSAVHRSWEGDIEVPANCEEGVICGIPHDCLLFPQNSSAGYSHNNRIDSNVNIAPSNVEVVQYEFPDQGFLDIQEEEVVCETWAEGVVPVVESDQVVQDVKCSYNLKYETEDVEIPLPQDQDSYLTARPYPCDFCSRRFRKKANLMNHMVAHQTDRPHGCNLCGARYRRKCDLINHMKIHAYAPGRDGLSDEDDEEEEGDDHNDIDELNYRRNGSTVKGRRRKGMTRRRKNTSSAMRGKKRNLIDDDVKDIKQRGYNNFSARKKYGDNGSSNLSQSHNYVEEDVKLLKQPPPAYLMEAVQSPEPEPSTPRWPVVDETRPYVCQHCGVGFAREKALGSHVRIHAGDSPFECNTCGEMFWDVGLLRDHSKMKHPGKYDYDAADGQNEKYGEFHCEVCGVRFHRQDLLRRHRRIHIKEEPNSDEGNLECQDCGQSFLNRADMLSHIETHGRYQPHRCMLCGECFMDSSSVAAHVKRKHAKTIPPNACTLCGKTCRDRRSLQKHAWVHSAERSFGCQKCGKRFHSRARLKRHMMSHRDKAVTCEECGEEFPDGRALINHRHSHNRDSSGRQFSCVQCGKTFGSRSSQQIHARIHTGERPYGCRFCWKAFADGGTLRKHERIHTGEKPYACPVCPRAFNQRVVLREHIRSHHSGPELRPSTTNGPHFVCKVCAASFECSEDLCAHLIKHSDENTAKHRLPKLGPRKYKRRRKFSVHELSVMQYSSDRLDSGERTEEDSEDEVKRKALKRKYKSRLKSNTTENLQSVAETLESVVQNLNSIVSDTKSDSTKKVSKFKCKFNSVNNVNVSSKQAKQSVSSSISGGFLRSTRPAGESRARPRTKNVTLSTLAALKAVSSKVNADLNVSKPPDSRARPRTKNVSYHNVKMAKLETAKFPTVPKMEPDKPKPAKESVKRKGELKLSKQSVFDSNTGILPDSDDDKDVKMEYTCEMCSETFTRRSELLIHVPIHI